MSATGGTDGAGSARVTPGPRERVVIGVAVLVLLALTWGYLFVLDREMARMAAAAPAADLLGSTSRAWSVGEALFTFAMWLVMMVGMMTLPALPMLLLFAAMQSRHGSPQSLATINFGIGYFALWAGFSVLATLAQWGLHEAALLSPVMTATDARVSGAILLLAGVYQLTPLKRACLARCRSPLGFLMTHWRPGPLGALRMGIDHGVYCLGCCWALMIVLFVVGVMNLLWVAALTLFVLLEKAGPAPGWIAKAGGVALIAAGFGLIAG